MLFFNKTFKEWSSYSKEHLSTFPPPAIYVISGGAKNAISNSVQLNQSLSWLNQISVYTEMLGYSLILINKADGTQSGLAWNASVSLAAEHEKV